VEVKVVDDKHKEVQSESVGEIVMRGDNVFVGYHNKMDKYKAVMDAAGWFYTGDRGYVDKDGFVYVLGRAGHNVKFADGEHHDLEEIGSRVIGYTKYISQIAIYGEYKDYPVAVVSLTDEEDDLKRMANEIGVAYSTRNEFAYNEKVIDVCKKEIALACETLRQKKEVQPIEDVRKVLYIRPMSEDNNEKTPTQKTRLNLILQKYEPQIQNLYESEEAFVVYKPKD
jgi:long-chain acyl-CoA synthetase